MKNLTFRKFVAWVLLVAMGNPFALMPAYALDSDIFLMTVPGSAAPEPNVLVILDTSDSMNLPEAWREYPGAYDSHVEYLWADKQLISNVEVPAQNANSISTAALPPVAWSKWGFWNGATLADRRALWTAARNSMNANFGSDPGPRWQYRNYNDLSWYYWTLESEAANEDTDFRLWSVSFNRFRGYKYEVGGARGGVTYTTSWDFSNRNQCGLSKPHLEPSTVLAPSTRPQNAGKYSGTNWKRWNKYRNLNTVNNGSYNVLGVANGYARSYLDSTVAPPNNPIADNTSWGGNPGDWGLPIRTADGSSFAGWQDVRADLGGFYYVTMVGSLMYHYYLGLNGSEGWGAVMAQLRTNYGYPLVGGEFTAAMKGNRDAPPADFSKVTGANFYYDIPADPAATCNPATGPASAHCINVPTGGSAGVTRYKTRTCAASGVLTEVDARGVTRQRQGTCDMPAADANCNDQVGSCQCTDPDPVKCATFADPPACSFNTNNEFWNTDYRNCAWSGRSPVSIGTCAWAGRSSVYVEGVGMYYYGGTCTESGSADSCQITGTVTAAVNGVVQNYVTGPYAFPGSPAAAAAGCSNKGTHPAGVYYYGGTCEGQKNQTSAIINGGNTLTGPDAANCNNSAAASFTIRGTVYNIFGGACSEKADNNQQCRGGGARYGGGPSADCWEPSNACPNRQTSAVIGATGSTPQYYAVYNRYQPAAWATSGGWWSYYALYPGPHHYSVKVAWPPEHPTGWAWEDDWFAVHDCLADDNTGSNPGGGYLRAHPQPGLGSQWNNGLGDVYTGPGNAFAPDPDKNITVYSVNYLNWKFGPRGPNGHPIGRKTRLQIAKGALSAIVNATDNVRMGLMAFNRTAGCTASSATATDAVNVLTEVADVGFTVGQAVKVIAVGNNPGTTDLNTTITAIDTLAGTVTLAAAPANSRLTTIQANPCATASRTNEGAFIAQQVVPMGIGATPEKAALTAAINNLTAAARTPLTESLYEAYRYFSGRVPRWGTATTPAAIGGVVTQGRDVNAVCSGGVTAECPFGSGFYKSPMMSNPSVGNAATCQKNYIILITDGGPEDDWGGNAAIKSMEWAGPTGTVSPRTTLDAGNADTATAQFETSPGVPFGPTDLASTAFDSGYIWLDELAHFMFAADVSPGAQNFATDPGANDKLGGKQGVRTFTIGFAGGNSPVLSNTAAAGSGSYYVAEDSAALSTALIGALGDIVAWTPTFAAPTVPLSVLNRSQNAADVYLAFFEPDASQAWNGTVKRFRISVNPTLCGAGTEGCFIGQTELIAPYFNIEDQQIDPVSGATNVYVNPDAVSFWLPTTEKDGGSPKKGGTGYVLKNTTGYDPSNRKVYTYLAEAAATSPTNVLSNAGNAVSETNTGLITKALLGNAGMTDLERANLINFIRGGDIAAAGCNDSDTGTTCTAWRSWAHFDVQHSRPAVVQYNGTAIADPAIPAAITAVEGAASRATAEYLYYVSNDGLLHAVDTLDGSEKWTFLIEEAFPKIAGMKNDNSASQLFVADGAPAVHFKDNNGNGIIETGDGDKVWIYFGLRRGGRVVYALDITEKDNPKFMWKISAEGGTGRVCDTTSCSNVANYNELGQTWSTPVIAKVRALGAADPVLIFAGGYDPLQDNVPPAAPADTMGRALYVVRGDNATIVGHWKSGGGGGALTINSGSMSYSIPSDVTALNMDLDGTGYIDRLYVGDMGGQVWRFDVDDVNPTNWRAKVLADLSDGALPKRKVFFAPAVAKQNYAGRFDAVYVGTGDREKPLCLPAASVTVGSQTFANPCPGQVAYDRMFMVMDPAVGNTMNGDAAYTMAGSDFALLTSDQVAGADLTGKKGWSRALEPGEKVTGAATLFFGVLRFGTYAPLGQSVSCAPLGEGRLNEISGDYGQLRDLTGNGVISAGERYYTSYLSHGYVSSGQAIIIGNAVYHVVVQSGVPRLQRIATLGVPSRIFWYMQPER